MIIKIIGSGSAGNHMAYALQKLADKIVLTDLSEKTLKRSKNQIYIPRYKILCNAISPHGLFNNHSKNFQKNFSQRSPLGRMSLPHEVLPAIDYLLDENNKYTNGIELMVNG